MIKWVATGMIVSERCLVVLSSAKRFRFCEKQIRFAVVAACMIVGIFAVTTSEADGFPRGVLSGSVSSGWYLSEDGENNRVQSYNALRGSWQFSGKSAQQFQIRTNLRWRKDWDNSVSAGEQLSIYETYAQYASIANRLTLSAGRQFVFTNLGSGLVDGGRIHVVLPKKMKLDFYAGSQVMAAKPTEIQSFYDYGTVGGRFSGKFGKGLQWGIDGNMRKYRGSVSQSVIGMDLAHSSGIKQVSVQTALDIANRKLALVRCRVSVSPTNWNVSGEFILREPSVRANSIFSVVKAERYQLARLGVRRTIRGTVGIDGSAQFRLGANSNTLSTTVGLSAGSWGLGWRHQEGRGTLSDGVYGFANFDLSKKITLYGNTDLSRYRVQELQEDLSDSYSASAGLAFRPGRQYTIEIEGQYLRNAVWIYDSRLFFRVTKGFSLRHGQEGARP